MPFIDETRDETPLPTFLPKMDNDWEVPLQNQEHDQWCWAAVGVGVSSHYAAPNPPPWTQCTLANAFLERCDCCGPAGGDETACNMPQTIDTVLQQAGDHFKSPYLPVNQVNFQKVRDEIDGKRPVVLQIRLDEAGKAIEHFVVVDACKASSGSVMVKNPNAAQPSGIVSFVKLKKKGPYDGWKWHTTFFTQPTGTGGGG